MDMMRHYQTHHQCTEQAAYALTNLSNGHAGNQTKLEHSHAVELLAAAKRRGGWSRRAMDALSLLD